MALNNQYNKALKNFARAHRLDSTKAEIRIWCELLSKRKLGYSFLRQRPIARFIVDFMCRELNLIIEVDGYSHNHKMEEDQQKDKALTDLGFTVLRFTDGEVMNDLDNVRRTLESWIEEHKLTS